MSLETIRTLYAHHWWANRTLLDVAARLGEEAVAREVGKQFSEPTLKRMFLHLYSVDLLWLSRWRGVSPTAPVDRDVLREAEVAPTLAALGERWVGLERVPAAPQIVERADVEPVGGVAAHDCRRPALPRLEPEPVGAVHVHEHRPRRGLAELLAHFAPGRRFAKRRHDVEEPAVGPVVVCPVLPDQLDRHGAS